MPHPLTPPEPAPVAEAAIPEADAPIPPRAVRILLRVFEVVCWLVFAFVALGVVIGLCSVAAGTVMDTAQVLDGGRIAELSGGAVDGGYLDVTLTGVPFSVSWPYFVWMAAASAAWLFLFAMLARLTRGLRLGRPFGGVRPVVLFVFAGMWTVLSFAGPAVMASTRPAMAAAAGVQVPGATFAYAMTFEDLASVFAGPLFAVLVGILVTGSRLWREQRTLV